MSLKRTASQHEKILIHTETFKNNSSHLLLTSIPFIGGGSIRENIAFREDKYNDVSGFIGLSLDDVKELVVILDKSLVCINDSAKVVYLEDGEVKIKDALFNTVNDVNYDVWVSNDSTFWNPVDFLLDSSQVVEIGLDANYIYDNLNNIYDRIDEIDTKLEQIKEALDD